MSNKHIYDGIPIPKAEQYEIDEYNKNPNCMICLNKGCAGYRKQDKPIGICYGWINPVGTR